MFAVVANRFFQLAALLTSKQFDATTAQGRASERQRRAALSAATAAVAKILSVASILITVPLTLSYLGAERYGMWMVISSFTIMLSFADLGIGNGIVTAVANLHGKSDRVAIRNQISSALALLGGVGVLIALVAVLVVPHARSDVLFNVTTEQARAEAAPALSVFLLCLALALPTGIAQKVQMGLQKGFTANLWQCLGSLLGLAGVIATIQCGGGVPWLVAAVSGAPLIAAIANFFWFFLVVDRDLRPGPRHVTRAGIRRIAHVGLLFFALQIVVSVAFAADNLIIARVLGASAVATYAIPEKMFALITSVVMLAVTPLWPAYGEAIARGDNAWVRRALGRSIRFAMLAAALASAALVAFGGEITRLWVGTSISAPIVLLACLGIWKTIEAGGNALTVFLNGAGQLKLQLLFLLPMAISSILLKILLVKTLGLPGIAIGMATAYVLFVVIPWAFLLPRILRSHATPGT
ncbi:MAG: oligosaccharide flippase family protein [Betaproteobacteria bacterium]